jgi:hypothetical protein
MYTFAYEFLISAMHVSRPGHLVPVNLMVLLALMKQQYLHIMKLLIITFLQPRTLSSLLHISVLLVT